MANELHTACQKGDLDKVKTLIANDSSLINQPHTIYGTYPIFFAAQEDHLKANVINKLQ